MSIPAISNNNSNTKYEESNNSNTKYEESNNSNTKYEDSNSSNEDENRASNKNDKIENFNSFSVVFFKFERLKKSPDSQQTK